MKRKILFVFFLGFLLPPFIWNISMWFSGLVNGEELKELALYPLQGIFAFIFLFIVFVYFNKKLNHIQFYLDGKKGNKNIIQKTIGSLPKKYVVLLIIFCGRFIR